MSSSYCYFSLVLLLSAALQYAGAQSTTTQADQMQYANFSPSVAIIIVVLMAALFLMAFFSIYIRHCTENSNGGSVLPIGAGQITGRSRRANRGLDPAVMETFPTFTYASVKGLKIGKGALECAVCLNEFEDDETLRLLHKCDHVFHAECIDAWLSSHTTCPVCRANLTVPAGETLTVGEVNLTSVELNPDSDESTHNSNINNNSVSIRVTDDQNRDDQVPESSELNRNKSTNNRSLRSRSVKSILFLKFPRSHSTGHSLIQPGENVDRFTLRLPAEVRKQIMNRALDRSTSLLVLPRETSSRIGYRTGDSHSRRLESLDRVGKSDRWVFSMAPPFFARESSFKSPKTMANDGEGSSSTAPRGFITALKKSFGRLNSKGSEPGLPPAFSPRPAI